MKKKVHMHENKVEDIRRAIQGDKEALERLVEQNSGLVWNIVKRFLQRGYEAEDLYQIGCIGLIKAIKRFDLSYEVQLSTYAVPYILGEIKKFIRDDGIIKVSRSTKELGIKIREIEKKYVLEKGESISIKKLSELLNVPEVDIVSAIEASKQVESINEEVYEDGSCTKIDKIVNNRDEQGKIIDKIVLNEMVNSLKERDKKIIILRFYKEKTQTQVAKILGISQVQVSRIEKRILKEFRNKLINENVSLKEFSK